MIHIPGWSLIQNSFLHLQAVWVGVKSFVIVEIINVPLCDDLVAFVMSFGKTIKINIKLDWLLLLIDGYVHDHSHFNLFTRPIVWAFKIKVHLLILGTDRFFGRLQSAVNVWSVLFLLWPEYVDTGIGAFGPITLAILGVPVV